MEMYEQTNTVHFPGGLHLDKVRVEGGAIVSFDKENPLVRTYMLVRTNHSYTCKWNNCSGEMCTCIRRKLNLEMINI